jgi:hypothetical protein
MILDMVGWSGGVQLQPQRRLNAKICASTKRAKIVSANEEGKMRWANFNALGGWCN